MQELLKDEGARQFVKVGLPKEELATMPIAQQERVRELQNVLNILAKRAKARKKP